MRIPRTILAAFALVLFATAAFAVPKSLRPPVLYAGGRHPTISLNLTVANTLPSTISYSATSLRTELDSNGFITYAPNNQYLNSNDVTTASWAKTGITITTGITDPFGGTTAQQYAYSSVNQFVGQPNTTFDGVSNFIWCGWVKAASNGTIHLSDNSGGTFNVSVPVTTNWVLQPVPLAAVASGTRSVGLNRRTGDLATVQVYGQVLSKVTYETSCRPSDQVITTSSAYYGPAFDSNYPSAGYQGLRSWQTYTNVDLWNRDLTNAAWTATNITAAHNQTGIDNVANSASSLTATANNGTICQAITLASSARQQAIYVKRLTGTGAVSLSMDGGATYHALTVTSSWGHQSITAQTLANPQTCIKLATSGDSIAVDGVQNDNASAPLAPVAFTTSTAVAVAADIVQATGTLAACFNSNNMTTIGEIVFNDPLNNAVITTPTRYLYVHADVGEVPSTYNGLTVLEAKNGAVPFNTPVRLGMTQQPSERAVAANGGGLNSDNAVTSSSGTVTMGAIGGSQWIDGYLRKIACWSPALPNNLLQQKSVVGPGPITWLFPANDNFAVDERRKAA